MNRFDCRYNFSDTCTLAYSEFDIKVTNFVQPNVVDPLCVECSTDSDGKVKSVAFRNDISLLFNQQRLEKVLGKDGLKKFFDNLSSRSSAFSDLRKKVSDDDLASMCKSRYLQSPSEILAWSDYLNNCYDSLSAEVKSRHSHSDKIDNSASADNSAPADNSASV